MATHPNGIEVTLAGQMRRGLAVTSPAPREIWKQVANADPLALVTQTPGWMDAMAASGTYRDVSRLYQFQDGRRAVLPLARKTGWPEILSQDFSQPNSWGMGGLLSDGPLIPADVAAVFEDLRQRPVLTTSIRINPLEEKIWATAKPEGVVVQPMLAHVLDLEGGFQQVWSKDFNSETRTAVRKAERSGLVVELDTTGRLIPQFYQLFELSVERWAKKQNELQRLATWRAHRRDPVEKFIAMARCIGSAFHLWMAWKGGQPAAAILVLMGKNAHYTRGVMDQELAGPTRANSYLHRLAIEAACLAGCRSYHMGESGRSSSLARFKQQFGARPVAYGEYRVEKLPLTAVDHALRGAVKRMIGFKDAS